MGVKYKYSGVECEPVFSFRVGGVLGSPLGALDGRLLVSCSSDDGAAYGARELLVLDARSSCCSVSVGNSMLSLVEMLSDAWVRVVGSRVRRFPRDVESSGILGLLDAGLRATGLIDNAVSDSVTDAAADDGDAAGCAGNTCDSGVGVRRSGVSFWRSDDNDNVFTDGDGEQYYPVVFRFDGADDSRRHALSKRWRDGVDWFPCSRTIVSYGVDIDCYSDAGYRVYANRGFTRFMVGQRCFGSMLACRVEDHSTFLYGLKRGARRGEDCSWLRGLSVMIGPLDYGGLLRELSTWGVSGVTGVPTLLGALTRAGVSGLAGFYASGADNGSASAEHDWWHDRVLWEPRLSELPSVVEREEALMRFPALDEEFLVAGETSTLEWSPGKRVFTVSMPVTCEFLASYDELVIERCS